MSAPRIVIIHRRTLLFCACFVLLTIGWWLAALRVWTLPAVAPTEAVAGKVVVIDPGHGGVDPGAVGYGGTLEKDVVLAVADALYPLLNRVSVYTVVLRGGDYDLVREGALGSRKREDLRLRVETANAAAADLYISLHANSFPSPRWSGAQTFFYPGKGEGKNLAIAIQSRLVQAFPANTRRARAGEYYVLRETAMPAVVVEVGFLSNPREEELLTSRSVQEQIARAIFRGIVDYWVAEEKGRRNKTSAQDVAAEQLREESRPDLKGTAPAQPREPADPDAENPREFLVYFDSPSNAADGLAATIERFPEDLIHADLVDRMRYALGALVSGPSQGSALVPTVPPGAKVLEVTFESGRVVVDLSREVHTRFWGGGRSEELLIKSVVRTAGQFPGVKEVLLSVEGSSDRTLAGHVDISRPFVPPARTRP